MIGAGGSVYAERFELLAAGLTTLHRKEIGSGGGRPLPVMLLPEATNRATASGPPVFYYLPALPALARSNVPAFSLTLFLGQQPDPGTHDISALIRQGVLSFDATLALPLDALAELRRSIRGEYRPLFAREARFELADAQGEAKQVLASATANGPEPQAALSATLDRTETLAVLAALDGTPGPLSLRASVTYRAAMVPQTIRLDAGLEQVFGGALDSYDQSRFIHLVAPRGS